MDTVLFGKYQLCRILGTGRSGTVFLAVHKELEEYRAIKRVPKSFVDYERFRREALILKELRHPGIPIVYDVEEDETYSYLIEEYLEGESLYDLVKRREYLTREETVHYGLLLTRIVEHLHVAGSTPILHLDLQPRNLILCHGTVKLLDFDHAATVTEANAASVRYGTVECAAPEQYARDEPLDERTDLYAIGVILHYCYTGRYPDPHGEPEVSMDEELAKVIHTLLAPDRNQRFESAGMLGRKLEELKSLNMNGNCHTRVSSLTLAVAGNKSGAGTTHMAAGLSVCMSNLGYPNLYEEKNDSGMGNALGAQFSSVRDHCGIMQYRGFAWKPAYGPGVHLAKPPYRIRVLDYGAAVSRAAADHPDGIVLVCDGAVWNRGAVRIAAGVLGGCGIPYVLVYNHVPFQEGIPGETRGGLCAPEGIDKRCCLRAPQLPDPFHGGKTADGFYRGILSVLSGSGLDFQKAGVRLEGRSLGSITGRVKLWLKRGSNMLRRIILRRKASGKTDR